jgi:ferredoxin
VDHTAPRLSKLDGSDLELFPPIEVLRAGARDDIPPGTRVRLIDNEFRTSWTRPEVGKLGTVIEHISLYNSIDHVRARGYYRIRLDVPPWHGHAGVVVQSSASDFEILDDRAAAVVLARDVLRTCLHLRWTIDLPDEDWDRWPLAPGDTGGLWGIDKDHDEAHGFLNQNWEHAACLGCGAIISVCEYCGSGYHVQRGALEYTSARSGVPLCSMCLRCVRCCSNVGRELPLQPEDVARAIERFVRSTRHHYLKKQPVGRTKPWHEWEVLYAHDRLRMDATRYSVEEKIVEAESEAAAVQWLLNDPHVSGGGRRGDYLDWCPRGHDRGVDVDEEEMPAPGKRRKPHRGPAGLYVDFDHRRGVVDPLTIVRTIRGAPRATYVCLACGGEFVSMLAECPFWNCRKATRARHSQDANARNFGVLQILGAFETTVFANIERGCAAQRAHAPTPIADRSTDKNGQWSLF